MESHPATDRDRRVRRVVGRLMEIAGVGIVSLLVYFAMPLDGALAEVLAGTIVVVGAGALVPLSVRRARQVLVSDQPLLVAAQSLFSAITLLIVSFASTYYVLSTQHLGQISGISTKVDALYFAVTIMSTVGFGDITAIGQVARVFVTGQMVVDFVLIAIAVRVVSWALKQREDISAIERIEH